MKNHNFEKARDYLKMAIKLDPENKNASEMYEYLIDE
jgi:uncharacterized protein HemY